MKRRDLQITGRASIAAAANGAKGKRFSMVAYSGEPIRQWWCMSPLVVDLATLRLPSGPLPILYDHRQDAEWVAGRSDSVVVENNQLLADGPVYASTEGGRKVIALSEEGHQWQASIGADFASMDTVKAGEKIEVNGREYTGPVEVVRGADLREISFVVVGAARNTSAVVARRIKGGSMDFDTWVQSLGFTPGDLDDTQRANLQKMFDAEYGDEGDDSTDSDDDEEAPDATAADDQDDEEPMAATAQLPIQMRRVASAELTRQHSITRLCASGGETPVIAVGEGAARREVPLVAHAIEEGWTVERTELQLLRQRRPTMRDSVRGHDQDCTLQAMQGAMLLRAGGRLDHPSYQTPRAVAMGVPTWLRVGINAEQRQRAMEASHRYSDMSMVDICREAIRLDGRDAPHGRSEMIRAAFSGSALTNIFTTNINAQILSTYAEHPDTTVGWVRETDVADFKTQERPRMTKGPSLAKLPRGGEADHVSRSDTGESYKIARYARQVQIDEQDIIDDRFNALADMPTEMGYAAARLRPDLVYAILKANAALADSVALFHSSHSNTDTSAALAADKLKAGVTAIRLQRENSVNLNLMATHLIVPTTLEFTARELINSTMIIIAGTAGSVTERGNANTLGYLGLNIVADARLDNGVIDPSSGTSYSGDVNDWFLAASAGHTIEVGYLRGTGRAPQVRSFVLERGKWGIGWDVNIDIGAKALDYRSLYRGVG